MLEKITIEGFRKYEKISLENFRRVNFLLGDNNVGKTTVLEAIYAWACGQNTMPFLNIPLSRGRYGQYQGNPYWLMEEILSCANKRHELPLTMKFRGDYNGNVECFEHRIFPSDLLTDIDSSYKNNTDKFVPRTNDAIAHQGINLQTMQGMPAYFATPLVVAEWRVKHGDKEVKNVFTSPQVQVANVRPFVLAKYIDVMSQIAVADTVQIYAALKRERKLDELVKEMKEVYPEIANFDMLPYTDGSQAPVSVVKKDGTMLPLYSYGDGVQRWFYILGSIVLHKNSIICIDEIDTGFHPDAQYEFCRNLIHYAEVNNVQLFISSHNIEFIDKVIRIEDYGEDISIYTLKNNEGNVVVREMSANEARTARGDFDIELR